MDVLVVDDDEFAISVLETTLGRMGYSVVSARDGRAALEILRTSEIRLVITDWDMPEMSGIDLCRAVRREDLSGYVYVIMLTGREGARQRMEGLCAGADDFLNKPLDPEELIICLKQAERILSLETRDVALFALAKLAESRDADTGAHIERVQSYTRLIARALTQEIKANYGVDDEYIRLLYQTSPLHDLGKVGIPDTILLKPGKLTPDEFSVMKAHTIIGAQTLDAALQRFPNARFLQMARDIAATHHERFDGSGYPHGLAGEQIPLCGRIVAVADVYDALTSRRVYKEPMTHAQARAILISERGRHFDPEIVDAFLRAEPQVLAAQERLRDEEAAMESEPAPLPAPPSAAERGAASCRILVVEDDPILLAQVTKVLGATGEIILTAADGQEAMRILLETGPRVVVSDWVMPNGDGLELCRNIRSSSDLSSTHFIMLTAHSDKLRLLEAYQAGVDEFVAKPFDAEELLARVRAGIRSAKLHDELSRKADGSQALNAQLAAVNSRLERLTVTDDLTGLFNRRHAMCRLEEQWALVDRYGRPLSIGMIDIDHFKQINDTYGHDAGDAVLRRIAGILREQTRGTDAVCRVGGDEFLIVFPSQTIEESAVCAERCRMETMKKKLNLGGNEISVSISIGLATRTATMAHYPDLLKAADQALYAAKRAGRRVVRIADANGGDNSGVEKEDSSVMNDNASKTSAGPSGATASNAASASPGVAKAPIDMSEVLKRCGGDASFAAAVTERFRVQAGNELAKIEQALAASDAATLCRAAHSLKSMAAYMSADAAVNLAREIEDLGHAARLAETSRALGLLRSEIERAMAWIAQNNSTAAAPAGAARRGN